MLVLERDRSGVSIEVPENLDPTRRSGRVRLDQVSVSADDILPGAHDSALARARTLLAAEAVGGAADCVDSAVDYAKVRQQFGRTIATFQAIKHHCANMLVATESGIAAVWDASRAASEDEDQFRLAAASAAALAFPAYARNAELNIQVHGGIGFTWEHDAHLHLRRALVTTALFGGDAPADDVFERTAAGVTRENSLDLPPEAEEMRARIRADVAELAGLDKQAQRDRLIETGYVMPHWPKPWGLAADAVEQLVIEEEFRAAGIKRTDYGITAWVILTLVQHGTPWQIERFVEKALRKDEIWCQLFSEPDAGSDAASIKTKATRVDGGWKINGQKVWTSGAHYCARGLATVRTDPEAPKHAGITTVIVDMKAPEVEVRPLRQITGGSDFNEVFFNDLFVPDEDVVGEPNTGWTVARATLGNERVSIGGSGSYYAGLATQLVQQVKDQPDRLAGGRTRVGSYLAEENALRLLNLRRVARSVEGAGPGPEGNVTKLKLADHMIEGAAITAALAGPETALLDGAGALAGRLVMSARAHGDRRRHLRGDPQSDRRADPRDAARPADQLTCSGGREACCAARAGLRQRLHAHPAGHRIGFAVNDIGGHPQSGLLGELDERDDVRRRDFRIERVVVDRVGEHRALPGHRLCDQRATAVAACAGRRDGPSVRSCRSARSAAETTPRLTRAIQYTQFPRVGLTDGADELLRKRRDHFRHRYLPNRPSHRHSRLRAHDGSGPHRDRRRRPGRQRYRRHRHAG